MKILLAPDKFKGTFSATEIAQLLSNELTKAGLKPTMQPMADGGDGTAELLSRHHQARLKSTLVKGPLEQPVNAGWGYLPDKKTAFLDMAEASGLRHLTPLSYNPLKTTTYGTGQLIKAAVEIGAETIYLGVGGSATNDGGCGALTALGFRFLNWQGQEILPTGGTLLQIREILLPESLSFPRLKVLCDVETPFTGPSGATHTFASQKGATQQAIELLEEGMQHLAMLWQQTTGHRLENKEKSGAAGGLAGGLLCALQEELLPGAATFGTLVGLKEQLQDAQLVISGEGMLDTSSLKGKAIGYLAKECRARNIPLWVVCGQNKLPKKQAKEHGISKVFPLYKKPPKEFSDAGEKFKALIPELLTQIKKHFL